VKPIILNVHKLGDIVDAALDRITTYRLVLYLLCAYILAAFAFSLTGSVHFSFSAWQLIVSAGWLVIVCRLSNAAFSKLFKVPHNQESDLITALILSLIMTPAVSLNDYLVLAAAGVVAMLSKYVISYKGRHLFNPAAFGAFVAARALNDYASWWIGFRQIWPLLLFGGLLILRKIKRFQMAGTFFFIYLVYLLATMNTENIFHSLYLGLLATPVIYFATVMLTEPLTSPTKLRDSLVYAVIVGIFYSVVKLHVAPEEALLIGNIVAFLLAPNRSVLLSFVRQEKEASDIYNYYFHMSKKFTFAPGQYMEWTLPGVEFDRRGNRRYLTIASSPTEDNLMFSVKVPDKPSSYKSALKRLGHGDQVLASQLAGSFTLPADTSQKLAFIAGGIGVTPFRSMARYLIDNQQKRDIAMLYFVNNPDEIAYQDLFESGAELGLKTSYVASQPGEKWRGAQGSISADVLKNEVPAIKDRIFYISGPQGFVAAARQILTTLDVPHEHIKTDFFPGYN
jgi:ferredoxin-NADP reductase/Na+-translocating ferredoxin:NAD+ oxidoreductase RnfD subunit